MEEIRKSLQPFEAQQQQQQLGNVLLQRRHPPPIPGHVVLPGGGGSGLRVPPPLPSGAAEGAEAAAGVAYLIGQFGLDEVGHDRE